MNKISVKFCGLKTLAEVDAAIAAQVDAIGLVFVEKSPRFITPEQALPLAASAKQSGVKVVALFADHPVEVVEQVIQVIEPDILQFHGAESGAFCEQFNRAYWKAVPMLAVSDYVSYMINYPKAEAFLLDAFGGKTTGGSGQAFKWFKLPDEWLSKLILAGGINADNVALALTATGAQFIDTSSGIESVPGVKSTTKMMALMAQIKAFQTALQLNKSTT